MYFYIFDAIQILIQIGLYTYDFFFGLLCEGVVTNDKTYFHYLLWIIVYDSADVYSTDVDVISCHT
jgi:hypothetical protein